MSDSCLLCHLRTRELGLSLEDLEISLQSLSIRWSWERARRSVQLHRRCSDLLGKIREHACKCSACLKVARPMTWRVENWKIPPKRRPNTRTPVSRNEKAV